MVYSFAVPSTLVLTSCTSRKRRGAVPITLDGSDPKEDLTAIASRWKSQLEGAPPSHQVSHLYVGRAFANAYDAARRVDGELYVVSAGLGLVHESDNVPCYDLTFADPANRLACVLAAQGRAASDWWSALREVGIGRGSVADLIKSARPSLTLIALPSGYMDMLARDLGSLSDDTLECVRIFTSTAGAASLTSRLSRLVMPYDGCLESVTGYSGTQTDFAQRALLHYVSELDGGYLTLEDGRHAVSEALAGLAPRQNPSRTRLDDSQIAAMLRRNWKAHGGSSSRLLRFLRREAQVACEQSRFRDIWRAVKVELAAKEPAR